MAIEHSVIVDPNRHEPKGIASAAAGAVYVATGGGTDGGSWIIPDPKGFSGALDHQALHRESGVVDWKYPSGVIYSEMDIVNNAVVQNIAYTSATARATWLSTDANYVKCTGAGFPFAVGPTQLVTFDAVNDQFVIQVAGTYLINFWGSFLLADTNTYLSLKYAKNNTTPYSLQKLTGQSTSANDIINLSAAGVTTPLIVGDNISLYIAAWRAAGINTNVTLEDGGMTITLLHET
jgi:hypothetical protein